MNCRTDQEIGSDGKLSGTVNERMETGVTSESLIVTYHSPHRLGLV